MSLILTLDAGTTSIKGALFDLSGVLLCSCLHEYPLEKPAPDIVELDPEIYWEGAQAVIAGILEKTKASPDTITALGVTSQGETLIVLDRHGKPLRKAIVWLDNRAKKEADSIRDQFGREQVYQVTGQQDIVPGWSASKILWLRQHEPEIFKTAAKYLMVADYLIYRLTGRFATDHAMNPSVLYYDLRKGCWWGAMLEFLGISNGQLPSLLNSGEVVGPVVAAIGLSKKTLVTVAPIDQVTAAVGAGNIAPGMVTETTGCALAVCATVERPVYDPQMRVGLYRHALPGLFVLLPWIPTAGMILRWFRDEFGDGADYATMVDPVAAIAPGCEGLILLPHFSGMNSPDINPEAKGVLYGITTAHRKAHVVRAILESVAFALRDNVELLVEMGIPCRDVTSLGGAARSNLWLQIKADILQRNITVMHCEEATSLGTAILAATGTGGFSDIGKAVKAMVRTTVTISPNPENRGIYNNVFQQYKDLNKKLF